MNFSWFYSFVVTVIFSLLELSEGQKERRQIICQGDRKTISCKSKKVIAIVSSTYGRTNPRLRVCRSAQVFTSRRCGSKDNALIKTRELCEGKKRCKIHSSNSVFGDPCPRISVYLIVEYRCVKKCAPRFFTCAINNKCIPKRKVCNGKRDCKDGSDERDCDCSKKQFKCKTSGLCIPNKRRCNGKEDCTDGSDEEGCAVRCTSSEFACDNGKQCIPNNKKCDKHSDCNDGSDEVNCAVRCTSSEFACENGNQCIPNNKKCDKRSDCNDGSDEVNCPISCGVQAIPPSIERPDCPTLKAFRIVGGCAVRPKHSWPWVLQLKLDVEDNGQFEHECGAALISESYAITASHCFLTTSVKARWKVVAGRHKKEGTEPNHQVREISQILKFPNTGTNFLDKDLTLIKFDQPMTLNRYVSPVCLPEREPAKGDLCIVAGWGEVDGTGHADVLKNTVMPIVDTNKCNGSDALQDQITPYMFCAGFQEGKNDACQGDSGGPLMCKIGDIWYVSGLVSWGIDCAKPVIPGVYANVHKFVDWVKTQISIN